MNATPSGKMSPRLDDTADDDGGYAAGWAECVVWLDSPDGQRWKKAKDRATTAAEMGTVAEQIEAVAADYGSDYATDHSCDSDSYVQGWMGAMRTNQ